MKWSELEASGVKRCGMYLRNRKSGISRRCRRRAVNQNAVYPDETFACEAHMPAFAHAQALHDRALAAEARDETNEEDDTY